MESVPSLVPLPAAAGLQPDGPPCHRCVALCCRYYALEIDAPEDEEDFEQIKWYLIHGKSWVFVDDGHLEDPDEPLCDYFTRNDRHDLEFRTMEELDSYAKVTLARRAAQRAKRSAAASEAWARRKKARKAR
ncbi:MAG: hypothetical protein MUC67_08915 [Acidobacteria bacterium]|nr:hypothetical protein [Acidobacteriota bacterium]